MCSKIFEEGTNKYGCVIFFLSQCSAAQGWSGEAWGLRVGLVKGEIDRADEIVRYEDLKVSSGKKRKCEILRKQKGQELCEKKSRSHKKHDYIRLH